MIRWLVVAPAALALTVLVTWPLPRCFATCLGASEDPLVSLYFLQWVVHSLTTPGVRLLDAGIFAPYPRTLALGEYIPTFAAVAAPAILVTGNPVVGHNVALVAAYTLAGLGAGALAWRLLGAAGPALLAGIVFAYSPRLLHQAHNLQTLSTLWFPWLFLALERFLARPTWVAATLPAGVALLLAGSSMIAFMFAAVAAVVFLATAVAWGDRPLGRGHLLRLVGVGVPTAALLAAYVAPYRAVAREWGLRRSLAEVERYSTVWGDYLGVPPEHFLHRLVGFGRVVDLDHEALFPGLAVAGLAALGLVAVLHERDSLRARLAPYVATAVAAAVFAFGPTGSTRWGSVPLPYTLLYAAVPGFDAIRTPRRFAGFVALGLALLAATGAAVLVRRLRPGWRAIVLVGLAALILLESIGVPFPGTIERVDWAALHDVYGWLRAQDARTMVIELPMGKDWDKLAGAARHLRRTVNGASSYAPPHYDELVAAMSGFPDPRSVVLIRALRVDLVLVDRRWLDPDRAAALGALDATFRVERSTAAHLVYRVTPAAPPGVDTLEATAELAPPDPEGRWRACLTLWNPGPGFVALYPLHTLRLSVESDPTGATEAAERRLPLDLAPGAPHTECVGLPARAPGFHVRGEVDGAGHRHRFAVTDGSPPAPLTPEPGR